MALIKNNDSIAESYSSKSQLKGALVGLCIGLLVGCFTYIFRYELPLPGVNQPTTTSQNQDEIISPTDEDPIQEGLFCIDSEIPEDLKSELTTWANQNDYEPTEFLKGSSGCDLAVERNTETFDEFKEVTSQKYGVFSRFDSPYTYLDSENLDQLISDSVGNFYLSSETKTYLDSKGDLPTETAIIRNDIEKVLINDPNAFTIAPFDIQKLGLKATVLDKIYNHEATVNYPLTDSYWFSLRASDTEYEQVAELIYTYTGSNPDELSTPTQRVVITGPMDLGTYTSEIKTFDETNTEFNSLIEDADIAITNNRTPLLIQCTNQIGYDINYCGNEIELETLEAIGFDALGVNGDTVKAQGTPGYLEYLENINATDLQYYGGGIDNETSHELTVVEKENLSLGIMGYSVTAPQNVYAYVNSAGVAGAGNALYDTGLMQVDLERLQAESDLQMVDISVGALRADGEGAFQRAYNEDALDYGADVVLNSRPELPLGVEILQDDIVLNGLGLVSGNKPGFSENDFVVAEVLVREQEIVGINLYPFKREGLEIKSLNREGKDAILDRIYADSIININIDGNE